MALAPRSSPPLQPHANKWKLSLAELMLFIRAFPVSAKGQRFRMSRNITNWEPSQGQSHWAMRTRTGEKRGLLTPERGRGPGIPGLVQSVPAVEDAQKVRPGAPRPQPRSKPPGTPPPPVPPPPGPGTHRRSQLQTAERFSPR